MKIFNNVTDIVRDENHHKAEQQGIFEIYSPAMVRKVL